MNTSPHFSAITSVQAEIGRDVALSSTLQPDGKIVVAGNSFDGITSNFSVIRLNADGSLDSSFNGSGKTIIPVNSGSGGYSVTMQHDGKIVVVGLSGSVSGGIDSTVIRLNADGSLDNSFNGIGKVIIPVSSGIDWGNSVALQSDGKILVGGSSGASFYNFVDLDFSLIRLNPDGSLDTSFNGTGKALIPVGNGIDTGWSVIAQSDGKIVMAGTSMGVNDADFSLIRLNADGSLDTSFNGNGKAIIPVGISNDAAFSVIEQSDGKIYVSGTSYGDFAVVRLTADGSLDTSFNGNGTVIVPGGMGSCATLQHDGKIVVGGSSFNGITGYDFSLMRLNVDGSLDTSFNGTGKVIVPMSSSDDHGNSVIVQSDGKIMLSGTSFYFNRGSDFSVIRLNADGSLDASFNGTGKAMVSIAPDAPSGIIAPVALNSPTGSVSYTENAAPTVLNSSIGVVDAELAALNGGAGNYSGASVTVVRHGGANIQDIFTPLGNLIFIAGEAMLSGIAVATISNISGSITITFNSNATQAVVNEVLKSVGYSNSSDAPPASVQLDGTFSDGNTGSQGAGGALTCTGSFTVNIIAVNDAPTGVMTISGVAATGQTLTASSTLADADGLGAISYQWQANGVNISGANGAAYTLSAAENGKQVSIQVHYIDGGNTLETVASAATQLIVATNTSPQFPHSFNLGKPGTAIILTGSSSDYGSSVTLQPDGKIMVAGFSIDRNLLDFSLIRLNADGSLDTSFNGTGKAFIPVGSSYDGASSITLQSDGKIVVAGTSYDGTGHYDFSVMRLNADGSFDTSFNGTGKALIPVGVFDVATSLTMQSDGKIVVAGTSYGNNFSYPDFGVIRLNANGSLDTTFNGTGKAIIPVGSSTDYGYSVALQSDGKIVVAGTSYGSNFSNPDFAVIRLNANGSLDTTFNGTGKAIIDVGGIDDEAFSVSLQSDGKIVVAGTSSDVLGNHDFSLIRLNADGSLDVSFNGSGRNIVPVGSSNDFGNSVTLQSDGKIVMAGNSDNGATYHDFSLIRLNADGNLDSSFNGTGKTIIPVSSDFDQVNSVTVQSDGKIVVAGNTYNGSNRFDFSLVRLNPDGSLDTSFNPGTDSVGGSVGYTESASAIALDNTVAIFDAELGALSGGLGNYAGASVTLARHGGADAQDVFSALGNLSFSAGNVLLSGAIVGTLSNNAGTLVISFHDSATQAAVNEVLSSIGYANSSSTPPTGVQIDWIFSDGNAGIQGTGAALTASGSSTVNISYGFTHALMENTKLVTTVTSSDVLLGSAPKFALSGEDAALFKVSNKGILTMAVAPDYEVHTDANHNGSYKVDVTLTNAKSHYAVTQNLVVGVNFVSIDGTAGADVLKGSKGWDTLDGKAGDDVFSGGDGLDSFIVSAGHDTVKDFNALGKSWSGPGSEILKVYNSASVNATLKSAWSATSDTFNYGNALITTSGFAVDLSGVTSGTGWNVLNKGKATTLTGSMFDDTLTAGSGHDVLQGGAGNDTLIGGKLADTLTGGVGADIFQLNGLKGIATAHHITDFVSGLDHIELDSTVYRALGLGSLADTAWVDGTTATNINQHILYNSSNGELFYDVDGSGKKAAVLIGVLDNHAALTHGEFLVV